MNIQNARIHGKLQNLRIENGKILEITDKPLADALDVKGKRVIPGLIDVHSHGCMGLDTMDADFEKMCLYYARHGTTS